MNGIAEFFGEDVGGVYLPRDVVNGEFVEVLYGFADGVFAEGDMLRTFAGG